MPFVVALILLLAAALPARAATPDMPAGEARPPGEQVVRLLYTGMTGGLSAARVDLAELRPLYAEAARAEVDAGGILQDNAFRDGDLLAYTDQGPLTLEDFRAFLAAGPVTPRYLGPQALLTTDYAHVVDLTPRADGPGWAAAWLDAALRRHGGYPDTRTVPAGRWLVTTPAGLKLYALDLSGAAEPRPAEAIAARFARPRGWEMVPAGAVAVRRPGQAGRADRLLAVGRPLGDGLRRAWLAAQWRTEAPEATLAIDLGDLVEAGASELAQAQRGFTLARLGALKLDAIVPAENELALEAADWARLAAAIPPLAANLEPAAPDRPKPAPVLVRAIAGLRVAVIGLVDDRALIAAGVAGPRAAWRATDPLAAARAQLAALAAGGPGTAPDLVLIATNVRDERLQSLRHLDGAAAVVADMVGLPGDVFTEAVTLGGEARARVRTSYMVARSSPNRVARLEATFQLRPDARPALARLRNEARLVTDRLLHDDAWHAELNELLDRYQRSRRELILPDLREAAAQAPALAKVLADGAAAERQAGGSADGLLVYDRPRWARMVANAVRRGTGAEVAVVPIVPQRTVTIGPVSRLLLDGWLEVGDRLASVALPGKALKAIAAADAGPKALAFAGYDPVNQKVMGVAIADDELYRVTTTDRVARHAMYVEAIGDRRLVDRWRLGDGGEARSAEDGEPLSLRRHVVRRLQAIKDHHRGAFDAGYAEDLATLLSDPEGLQEPRWSLRFEDGELLTNAVQGAGDPAFAQVRNTRVTAPSSQALGGKGKLAVLHDSPAWALENRVRAAYKRATLTKDDKPVTQETEDEVVLTSELRMKRLAVPVAGTPLTPFWSWNYTTEFRPDEANGVTKPRRQELAAIGGWLYAPGNGFKELRAGGALKNDLANPGMLEPGFYLSGGWEQPLSATWPAKLRAGVEAFRYLATPTDTPDRLGLAATFTAGVAIPLWERITLNVGADWFVFAGKVPATERLRANLDFKIGLGYVWAWKPGFGVWY